MKTNAYTCGIVRMYQVWGEPDAPPYIELPAGTKIFVCWAPILQQWIASITHIDYRYDSIVQTHNFAFDPSLRPVTEPERADTYYLNRLKFVAN